MAIDTSSLSKLITEFRAIQAKDAISPESLGYILQRIVDLLGSGLSSDEIASQIQTLTDKVALSIQKLDSDIKTAKSTAGAAQSAAVAAKTAADNAQTTADNAQTAAGAAQSAADNAQTTADNAQTAAGAARSAADNAQTTADNAALVSVEWVATDEMAGIMVSQKNGIAKGTVMQKATSEKAGLMCAHHYNRLKKLSPEDGSDDAMTVATNAKNAAASAMTRAQEVSRSGAATPRFGSIMNFIKDEELKLMSSVHASTDAGCSVVYVKNRRAFFLSVSENAGISPVDESDSTANNDMEILAPHSYYANWADALQLGLLHDKEKGFYVPIPGVEYQATLPPYGRYTFDADGVPAEVPSGKQTAIEDSPDIVVRGSQLLLSDVASRRAHDERWKSAGGTVIEPGTIYGLNGLNDISYNESVEIMRWCCSPRGSNLDSLFSGYPYRTHFSPITSMPTTPISAKALFKDSNVEVVNLGESQFSSLAEAFINCGELHTILGVIICSSSFPSSGFNSTFNSCASLQELKIRGLNTNLSLASSPLISMGSLTFIVNNSSNTASIVIALHPDAFARLPDKLITTAQSRQITFVSV